MNRNECMQCMKVNAHELTRLWEQLELFLVFRIECVTLCDPRATMVIMVEIFSLQLLLLHVLANN